MVLAHVSEGGRRRTGLSWPNFSLEDILSLLPSPVSFPYFPEDMVFPYCLWDPKTLPCVLASPLLQNSFSFSLPSNPPSAFFSLPSSCCTQQQTSHPGSLVSMHHGPGLSSKEPACQCRRHSRHWFDPWVGKISWRRSWQPTPVFLPGESYGQRSLVGYSPGGCKESDTIECTHTCVHTHTHTHCSQGNLPRRGLGSGWEGPQDGLPDNSPPGGRVKLTRALGPRCRWAGNSLAPRKVAQGQMLLKTNHRSESLTASSAFCQRRSLQTLG